MVCSRVSAFRTVQQYPGSTDLLPTTSMRMDFYYCSILLLLPFALTCITTTGEGTPRVSPANGTHDERWRLVSGLETAFRYTTVMQCGVKPLLNVTGELVSILDGICELLEIQKLTERMYNETSLHAVLEQNILDICHWLNLLITLNDPEIAATEQFLLINDTCQIGDMPRLTSYCMETRLGNLYDDIYLPVSDYYADTVVNQNIPDWLGSSGIPTENADSIQLMLAQPCSD